MTPSQLSAMIDFLDARIEEKIGERLGQDITNERVRSQALIKDMERLLLLTSTEENINENPKANG